MRWSLADAMVFSMNELEDPDAEEVLAEALRVDDQGYFGLRVQAGCEGGDSYLLNVRGLPPEAVYDEEEGDEQGLQRRASFVEVLVPPSEDPSALCELAHALAEILPIRSGHGGWFARPRGSRDEDAAWGAIFGWCRRYLAIEPSSVDGWLSGALTRHRGAGWLTVLGPPFAQALGELPSAAGISRHEGARALVLEAGEPTLGDVARGEFPEAIAAVARWLEPVTLTTWARRGTLTMGGVWFSTFSSQLPGAFSDHHATEAFLRRFVDPEGFLGPTPRERGLELVERLEASMDAEQRAAWADNGDFHDIGGFRDLMRTLFNGACHTPDEGLRIEALKHAARFPDWCLPQTYNNLLHHLHAADRIDEAMAIVPLALKTAQNNVYTYHNAACVLVCAGELDAAMDCVQKAKDAAYPLIEKLRTDEDLAPLHDRPDWRELFEP
jgi:hypothetical protein